MKRPAFQFYSGDWLGCQEVRAVSLAARGLWMDMLCYMRQGNPVGHLTHRDGRPITPEQLARMVGESLRVVRGLLSELESAGVPGKADNGAYTSRRMLRDEQEYQRYRAGQAEAGKRGAAERWGSPQEPHESAKGANVVAQSDPTEIAWGEHASSSSSSSSSSKEEKDQETSPPASTPPGPRAEDLQAAWNELTTKPIPRCMELTGQRRRHAEARLRDRGLDGMREVFARINALRFCRGENDRGWRANFDWALKPVTIAKVLEGTYSNGRSGTTGRTGAPDPDKYAGLMEGIES